MDVKNLKLIRFLTRFELYKWREWILGPAFFNVTWLVSASESHAFSREAWSASLAKPSCHWFQKVEGSKYGKHGCSFSKVVYLVLCQISTYFSLQSKSLVHSLQNLFRWVKLWHLLPTLPGHSHCRSWLACHSCFTCSVLRVFMRLRLTVSRRRTCSEKHSARWEATAVMMCLKYRL